MLKFKTCTVALVAVALTWLAAPYATAAIVTLDFESVAPNIGNGPAYLSSYGITLTNVTPGPAGVVDILNNSGPGSGWVNDNFLAQNGGGAPPVSYTMNFATPLLSISFNRMATPPLLSWMPAWSATAYAGAVNVGSVGVPNIQYVGGGTPDQPYTLSGNGITSLTIYANGGGFTGIGYVPLDDFVLDQVPEPTTLIVWSLLGSIAIGIGWWRKRKAV